MTGKRLLVLLMALPAGCSSIGAKTVPQDQFDYNAAIARSSEEQLLLNLVRLRYSETPVFLKVSSVIAQYSRVAAVNAGVGANTSISGDNTASVGGRLAWSDRPTITYTPISGQEFSQNLLTPLPPDRLFGMMQAGWPSDLVFQMAIWSVNDIDNDIARPSRRKQAEPELFEMIEIWARLREASLVGMRRTTDEQGQVRFALYLLEEAPSAALGHDLERLRELFGVDPATREFEVTYGLIPEEPGQLAVLTGSIWDIMLNLAWHFEVPPEHVESGRTGPTFRSERPNGRAPIEVLYSEEKPEDAYVAVRGHGHWFYIDQHDRQSKRAFSFLQLLLNLAETSTPDQAPLVTISN